MKYMGSKSRITKYIIPIIQSYIDDNNIKNYYESFVGGANVIDKIKCENRYGTDNNKYLIALLNRVKNQEDLLKEVDRELYSKVRDCYNNNQETYEDWIIGNVGFLASYNGRFFDGGYAKSGYEKTKNGERFRDYYREAKDNILTQAPLLKDIKFYYCDYRERSPKNMVIYVDPPYENTKQYNTSKDFNHFEFWDKMREWSENNIVLISEENAPNDFECIWEQKVSRSIKAQDKSKSTEKLFIYKGEQ